MKYNWMPIVGDFHEENDVIIFDGKKVEYDGNTRPIVGNLVFNKKFNGGTISTEVNFSDIERHSECGIMVFFDNTNSQIKMLVTSIGGGPMASIKYFNGSSWDYYATTGDSSNLKSNTNYKLQVTLLGSKISFSINEVEVLSAIVPFSLPESQVGIFSIDDNSIAVQDFNVETEIPKVFVVMQFSSPFNELYNDVIKKCCDDLGLFPIRADECYTTGMIISDVINYITESKIIIADITPVNANVYYEVGYAHALKKPTILIAENPTKLPFDVSPFRVLFYENSIRGKKMIEEGLRKHLTAIISK